MAVLVQNNATKVCKLKAMLGQSKFYGLFLFIVEFGGRGWRG